MPEKFNKILTTVKRVLMPDPKLLYKEERHLVNQPFFFEGTNKKGVLLVHGWTTTPYELRRLGKYLNDNGYTVMSPMLRGHGTVPKDLEGIKWTDWMADLEKAYRELKNKCDTVYLIGTSIGSNLSIIFASQKSEVAGLVLMAAPYEIRKEKFVEVVGKFLSKIKKYNRKFYPPTFGVSTTITRLISYKTYPIKNALEVLDLIKKSRDMLPQISQPCYIIQSSSDHIVTKKSLEKIYEKIGSKVKAKKYIHRAYHTFISDIKNEHVFNDILNFLNEN